MSLRGFNTFDANGDPLTVMLDEAQQANLLTVIQHANAALTANATFLAIVSPTNAQLAAQAKLLTRECNGLIRFLLAAFSDITDT